MPNPVADGVGPFCLSTDLLVKLMSETVRSPFNARCASCEPGRGSRRGFTFIEVMVATAFALTSMLAFSSMMLSAHALRRGNEETQIAGNALRAIMEQVQSTSASSVAAPNGWGQATVQAFQPGGIPGDVFPVRGLVPMPGFLTVATVQVITDETLTDQQLGVSVGMPRDLDGDGLATNVDVTATATLLPVVVTLQWSGPKGARVVSQGFYVSSF